MQYSIIIPFRDRHEHLTIVRRRLAQIFDGTTYEIIVVEQDDQNKFRRGNLLNEGARAAKGDILIFHDVDYYPFSDPFVYWDGKSDCFLPVRYVKFVNNDLSPRDPHDIPGGYRHFATGVDADFFGGVITFTRDAFWRINGFSLRFVGWGMEDVNLRQRIFAKGLSVARGENTFYALNHPDSGPAFDDPDFQRNVRLASADPYTQGVQDGLLCKLAPRVIEIPTHWVRWLKVSQFEAPVSPIVASYIPFED